jgi:hypothetical protein
MKHYTPKQINEIKQEIRTGKPAIIIADDLAKRWGRPSSGIYYKAIQLAKQTRKIKNDYVGPTKRVRVKKAKKENTAIIPPHLWSINDEKEIVLVKQDVIVGKDVEQESVTIKEFEKIWDEPQEPAEICIEVPTGNISFIGIPSRVVIYSDHVRYYYNN